MAYLATDSFLKKAFTTLGALAIIVTTLSSCSTSSYVYTDGVYYNHKKDYVAVESDEADEVIEENTQDYNVVDRRGRNTRNGQGGIVTPTNGNTYVTNNYYNDDFRYTRRIRNFCNPGFTYSYNVGYYNFYDPYDCFSCGNGGFYYQPVNYGWGAWNNCGSFYNNCGGFNNGFYYRPNSWGGGRRFNRNNNLKPGSYYGYDTPWNENRNEGPRYRTFNRGVNPDNGLRQSPQRLELPNRGDVATENGNGNQGRQSVDSKRKAEFENAQSVQNPQTRGEYKVVGNTSVDPRELPKKTSVNSGIIESRTNTTANERISNQYRVKTTKQLPHRGNQSKVDISNGTNAQQTRADGNVSKNYRVKTTKQLPERGNQSQANSNNSRTQAQNSQVSKYKPVNNRNRTYTPRSSGSNRTNSGYSRGSNGSSRQGNIQQRSRNTRSRTYTPRGNSGRGSYSPRNSGTTRTRSSSSNSSSRSGSVGRSGSSSSGSSRSSGSSNSSRSNPPRR